MLTFDGCVPKIFWTGVDTDHDFKSFVENLQELFTYTYSLSTPGSRQRQNSINLTQTLNGLMMLVIQSRLYI